MVNKKVKLARQFQKNIQALKKEQDVLYEQALKELGSADNGEAVDYFFNKWSEETFEGSL